jgi:tRNA/rRNA methyltransferase
MSGGVKLDNIAIVLQQPRYPENIGAAARAMCNMGIHRLLVVSPRNFDSDKVFRLATHAAADVVDHIEMYDGLDSALSSFSYVVGTTARLGGQRESVSTPPSLAPRLAGLSQENSIAIVFGPEDRGLSNEDLRLCHLLVNIPTAQFSSLNLSQAVMIICYELFVVGKVPDNGHLPRLANRHELDGMYAHLRDILVRISYVNPENPDYWMNRLRHFGTRMQLRAREVSILRGICRQIDWYGNKCYEEGLKKGNRQEE